MAFKSGYASTVTSSLDRAWLNSPSAFARSPAPAESEICCARLRAFVTASSVSNLAFHKDAFTLVNRPLEAPMGGAESAVINMNGLAVRVTYGYDMTYKRNMLSWDILCGFKTLYPELAVRLLG